MSQKKIHGASAILLLIGLFVLCFSTLGQPVLSDCFEATSVLISTGMYNSGLWLPSQQVGSIAFFPALQQWSQLAGYQLFGPSASGARFLTAVAAVLVIVVFYKAAAKNLGKRTGLQAVLITASSLLFIFSARIASGDMLVCFFLLLNVILCWSAVEASMQGKNGADLMMWSGCVAGGLAMLSGGPVIGLVSILTAFFYLLSIGKTVLLFRIRWFIPGLFLLIITVLAPWCIAAVNASVDLLPALFSLFSGQIGAIAGVLPEYGRKVISALLILLLGMLPWCCYLGLAVTTSALFGKEQSSARFVRLFAIFSLIVLFVAPFSVHGVAGLAAASVPGAALLLSQLFERIDVQYSKRWILAGWLTVCIFAGLTCLLLLLPFGVNWLPAVIGEIGQMIPALSDKINLGYSLYLAAAILAGLTWLLYRGQGRRKVYAVYNGLTLTACGLAFVTVLLLQPLYDRMVSRPVSTLAVEGAARYVPQEGAMLLYNIGSRPAAEFYGKRSMVVKSEKDRLELQGLFDENIVQAGISTTYYLERLRDFDVNVKELCREHGYVLFTLE